MSALVVNFYGGPGTGKSTMAAALFAELKWAGKRVELVTEFAKGVVWEDRPMPSQLYILGKQYHWIRRAAESVDVVVTDSPLLLGLVYDTPPSLPLGVVRSAYDEFSNMDINLRRVKPYADWGRLQTEAEAIRLDKRIEDMLLDQAILLYWYRAAKVEVSPILMRVLGEVAYREDHRG